MTTIVSDDGILNEINVLTSNFIWLGYQLLGEMGCHCGIFFYSFIRVADSKPGKLVTKSF